jgi:hypothetical protein
VKKALILVGVLLIAPLSAHAQYRSTRDTDADDRVKKLHEDFARADREREAREQERRMDELERRQDEQERRERQREADRRWRTRNDD